MAQGARLMSWCLSRVRVSTPLQVAHLLSMGPYLLLYRNLQYGSLFCMRFNQYGAVACLEGLKL